MALPDRQGNVVTGVPGSLVGGSSAFPATERRSMSGPVSRRAHRLFRRSTWPEARRIADILRRRPSAARCCWPPRWPRSSGPTRRGPRAYRDLGAVEIGPAALHLNLDLATWAADGLLAIFFFVAGLELKREFVAGDLREFHRAAVPVAAAVGGVVVPALIYLAVAGGAGAPRVGHPDRDRHRLRPGGARGRRPEPAGRPADLPADARRRRRPDRDRHHRDLLHLHLAVLPLLGALVPLVVFALLVRRGVRAWWLLLPLAFAGLGAGPRLGRPRHGRRSAAGADGARTGTAGRPRTGRALRAPLPADLRGVRRAGLRVLLGRGGPRRAGVSFADPIVLGITAGLLVGKPVGILAATWLVARFTRATLDEGLAWIDMAGLAILGGIGFTVSLLIGDLAFGAYAGVKVAVLAGSLAAALVASVILRLRARVYRRIHEAEVADSDDDGVPDAYQNTSTWGCRHRRRGSWPNTRPSGRPRPNGEIATLARVNRSAGPQEVRCEQRAPGS